MNQAVEATEKWRKQLVYRANHRGIKEMDIILGEFARERLATLDAGELGLFEALLSEIDRDLLAWFTGEAAVPAQHDTALFTAILAHRMAKSRRDRA